MAIILIDFDGTITDDSEQYPNIGKLRPFAREVINKYYNLGHCILIFTCRCDEEETKAKQWLLNHDIKFCHINQNCKVRIEQYQNDTRKLGAHIHIDDRNLDTLYNESIDWKEIDHKLEYVLQNNDFDHEKCDNKKYLNDVMREVLL